MTEKENIIKNLSQTWKVPSKLSPIVIIGAGGIVHDAHLPAYEKAGYKVLAVHIIGAHAGELIGEAVAAIEAGLTAEDIALICHAHPTLSESMKEAASLSSTGQTLHF